MMAPMRPMTSSCLSPTTFSSRFLKAATCSMHPMLSTPSNRQGKYEGNVPAHWALQASKEVQRATHCIFSGNEREQHMGFGYDTVQAQAKAADIHSKPRAMLKRWELKQTYYSHC